MSSTQAHSHNEGHVNARGDHHGIRPPSDGGRDQTHEGAAINDSDKLSGGLIQDLGPGVGMSGPIYQCLLPA